jgi:hypothetical protein
MSFIIKFLRIFTIQKLTRLIKHEAIALPVEQELSNNESE